MLDALASLGAPPPPVNGERHSSFNFLTPPPLMPSVKVFLNVFCGGFLGGSRKLVCLDPVAARLREVLLGWCLGAQSMLSSTWEDIDGASSSNSQPTARRLSAWVETRRERCCCGSSQGDRALAKHRLPRSLSRRHTLLQAGRPFLVQRVGLRGQRSAFWLTQQAHTFLAELVRLLISLL